jgi:hypothetical protein
MINFSTLILCGADNGTAIPAIPSATCEHFGKVQRIFFQRLKKEDGTLNSMTLAESKLLATYTPLLTEETLGTKLQATPFTESPAFTDGTVRTARGGNDSYGGIPISLGYEPTEFEAQILSANQAVIKALKSYRNEASDNLGVILVSAEGKLMINTDDSANPTTVYPIPIQQFNVGNKVAGGYDDVDYNSISFQLEDNWSNDTTVINRADLDFDPLTAF